MLIDYAINYYCRPGLRVLILLRMYGCGCSADAAPLRPPLNLGPLLTLRFQRASAGCLCICCRCLSWGGGGGFYACRPYRVSGHLYHGIDCCTITTQRDIKEHLFEREASEGFLQPTWKFNATVNIMLFVYFPKGQNSDPSVWPLRNPTPL